LVVRADDKGRKRIFRVEGLVLDFFRGHSRRFFGRCCWGDVGRRDDLVFYFFDFRGNRLQSLEDILVIFILLPLFGECIGHADHDAGVAFLND